jgi:hypothetical protein
MPPATLVALCVVVLVVLPGSMYTWAYERQASSYGVTFADRTLRFIAVSVIFHLVFGWIEYGVYRLLTPERETRLLSAALGRAPAPRAWDNLFSERPNAYLRIRLVDGTWVGGRFAGDSYAGGFPHDGDLYLEEAWEVDQETGAFVGETGLGIPLYLPAGQIRWMEIEHEGEEVTADV